MAPADKVEIVRRGFDAFETMDMDAFTADWAPDVLWDVSGYENWPGSKTQYRGAPEILAEFGSFMGTVRALEVTDLNVTPLDDGRVEATNRERRISDGNKEPELLDIRILYEFDGDAISRIDVATRGR
jgi:ketosteroid isomerase-like protein